MAWSRFYLGKGGMTAAQTLARELVEIGQYLEPQLGPDAIAGADVRVQVERAGRTVTALGALVGLAPTVSITAADLRREKSGSGDKCPKCGHKLRLVPSSGFGPATPEICGACGYEPAA